MNSHYYTIPELTLEEIERFWPKVNKDGPIPPHQPELGACWIYTGFCKPYGRFKMRGNNYPAHRIAYVIENGPESLKDEFENNLLVCHKCDNPICVRTGENGHLFVGTSKDNKRDCIKKNRHAKRLANNARYWGEKHPNSRLSDEQIEEAKRMYLTGKYSQQKVAQHFGVTQSYISKIILNQTRMRKTDELIPEGSTQRYSIDYKYKRAKSYR